MTDVYRQSMHNDGKKWNENIDQLLKLHNISDKPTLWVSSGRRGGSNKPNPNYIKPFYTYCNGFINHVDYGNRYRFNEYNQARYNYYVKSIKLIEETREKEETVKNEAQRTRQAQNQLLAPTPIVQPPVPTPIAQTQAMLLETHAIIKDLQSKLDEQLKLNETLCKRLFELKN